MLVILGETRLDRPGCFDRLSVLFNGYSASPPVAFLMTGNFLSPDSVGRTCVERVSSVGSNPQTPPPFQRRRGWRLYLILFRCAPSPLRCSAFFSVGCYDNWLPCTGTHFLTPLRSPPPPLVSFSSLVRMTRFQRPHACSLDPHCPLTSWSRQTRRRPWIAPLGSI